MLLDSKGSILEIALKTGFPDEQNFIEAFKKQYHETPGKYRKKYKEINRTGMEFN